MFAKDNGVEHRGCGDAIPSTVGQRGESKTGESERRQPGSSGTGPGDPSHLSRTLTQSLRLWLS